MAASSIQDAISFADETKELVIRRGAISDVSAIFDKYFSGRTAVPVADENTFVAAGKKVADVLKRGGIKLSEPFIFPAADLHAEDSQIDKLLARIEHTREIPIAIGSGTINDMTKLASYRAGRPYICVATAASMDGYASTGAAVVVDGIKQTCPCPAPMAVIADLDVICKAPSELAAYGYGDLASKITAGADWILADALGLAPIKKTAWDMVQTKLRKWLANPDGVKSGKFEAIEGLFEGLVVSGLAMQYAKDSRPASGAEHLFSHIWDMKHHKFNGKSVSHGFQVAIGTLATSSMYETMFNCDIQKIDIAGALAKWPSSWDDFEKFLQKQYPPKDCVLR
ncbi:MAG TPA: sn-glycerol-1-phosphate dehydrogenase, partial [Phycisphaerae bacterium]|nr:sn-glycerol-1-phosphate dehydrogenase [Phycisphaerae bacterium]